MLDADNPATRDSNIAKVLPAKAVDSVPYVDFKLLLTALSAVAEIFVAPVTGISTAITVTLPFDPVAVLVINETTLAYFWQFATMAAASAFKQVTAGTLSKITTNGITMGAKNARTVTLGTGVQTTSDVVHLVAIGNQGGFGGV